MFELSDAVADLLDVAARSNDKGGVQAAAESVLAATSSVLNPTSLWVCPCAVFVHAFTDIFLSVRSVGAGSLSM